MSEATSPLVPYHFAKRHGVILAVSDGTEARVYTRPGAPTEALFEIQRFLGRHVEPEPVDSESFAALLAKTYEGGVSQAEDILNVMADDADLTALAERLPEAADLLDAASDAPVVQLINALLSQAVRESASDIHIEPFQARSAVRFRVDGVLRDVLPLQRSLHGLVVGRVKVLAKLDIAEKRLPQDGRFTLRLAGRTVDIRVSTLPTGHGETAVLRLLDKKSAPLELAALGLSPAARARLDHMIRRPHGILLVTGPTGSGKTTTLYAALARLNSKERNIVTVEDPIEYDMEGIGQTQVNAKIGLTFAHSLRSILRQDPDVIMIGEIRDLETAQSAVQASLTGHLVLATLHTNDAVGAVTRLIDMGIEPFLVASSLIGVLAQRLVRRLCPSCRKPDGGGGFRAVGCAACRNNGYQGRTGIYELLEIDDTLRRMIHARATEAELENGARASGMVGLREDGARWITSGETTASEVLRVTTA